MNYYVRSKNRGFALIATISITGLLLVLAFAMMGLSSIELRTVKSSDAIANARANARMALMLAIGELQKEMGPDQRISGKASILANDSSGKAPDSSGFDGRSLESGFQNPHWMGVWNSWDKWLDGNSGGITSTYTRGRKSNFRKYLVSHPNPNELANIETGHQYSGRMVEVIGEGTLGSDSTASENYVEVPTVDLGSSSSGSRGSYAWHISGANQCALANFTQSGDAPSGTIASTAQRLAGHPKSGVSWVENMDLHPGDEDTLDKIVSLQTFATAVDDAGYETALKGYYHDLTTFSYGLPVNVRDGQLKRDMNTLLELDRLPSEYGFAAGAAVPIRSFNGDFGTINGVGGTIPRATLPSWYKLHQYYKLASGPSSNADESAADQLSLPLKKGLWWDSSKPSINYNWHNGNLDENGTGRTPIAAKIMVIFSLVRKASATAGKYNYSMNYSPVITMWNPYNVTLHAPPFQMLFESGSISFKAWINDAVVPSTSNWLPLGGTRQGVVFTVNGLNSPTNEQSIKYLPGETRVFSVRSGTVGANPYPVTPGYDPPQAGGGLDLALPGLTNLSATDKVEIAMQMTDVTKALNAWVQNYLTITHLWKTGHRYNEIACSPVERGNPIPIIKEDDRIRFLNSSDRQTIGSFSHVLKSGERVANPGKPYDEYDFRSKNFAFARPWSQRSICTANSKFMRSFAQYDLHIVGGVGNSGSTDFDPATNRGYIGSANSIGNGDYEGQTILPLANVPLVSPTSLAEFMHFKSESGDSRNDIAHWSPSSNDSLSVGSSFGSPYIRGDQFHQDLFAADPGATDCDLFKRDVLFRDRYRNIYDHTLLLNDGVWDRWYCSGITAQSTEAYGQPRSIKDVSEGFLTKDKPLNDSHYAPNIPSGETSDDVLNRMISGSKPKNEAHKEIAQYMTIRGAFNVNSTSVEAWKALFAGLRDDEIRYIDPESGAIRTTSVPTGSEVVITSRFSLPSSPDEGADAEDPNSWRGIRKLTKPQIDRLARECVRQVKLRGPFLNLADFINRRLEQPSSSGTDGEAGLAGALQAAIDWDEYNGNSPGSGNESINGRYKTSVDMITSDPWALPNSRAFMGSRWTAIPGYLTQADLLKRIGNVITPRDDTFRIRAYGEVKDSNDNVIARAWCEATVGRQIEFHDEANEPDTKYGDLTDVNKSFGRQLKIMSFRWLAKDEI